MAKAAAPAIIQQPQSISVYSGQPATFTISASGAQPLNFQWKKNGTNISGANQALYTINTVTKKDSGNYSTKQAKAMYQSYLGE